MREHITELDLALSEYSDIYKEKFYMRPRNIDPTWTTERIRKKIKAIAKELNEEEWGVKQ